MLNKTIIAGFLVGLLLPIIGIFLGLQVNTTLGNIFAFPFVLGAMISNVPFGQWYGIARIFALLVSGLVWAGIFHLIKTFFRKK